MDKSIPEVNQKRSSAPKQPKTTKKQHPLKVVYITNPIKFKATASEFRALVQELTGQDADMSKSGTWYDSGDGGSAVEPEAKVAAGVNVHALVEEGHMMNTEAGRNGSDPFGFRSSYEDVFYMPEMMEGFGPGLVGCHEAASKADVYKSLDEL